MNTDQTTSIFLYKVSQEHGHHKHNVGSLSPKPFALFPNYEKSQTQTSVFADKEFSHLELDHTYYKTNKSYHLNMLGFIYQ